MGQFLKEYQVREYRVLHRTSKDKRVADKIKAIILRNDGWSYEQIAKALLLDETTVRRYESIFIEKGIEDLIHDNYDGGVCKLNEIDEQALAAHLKSMLYPDAKTIVAHVEQTYGITYTVNGMIALLRRLGFVYKKPRRVPGKADAAAQRAFVEIIYPLIKQGLGPDDKVYFTDGMHLLHNSVPAYGWIYKGDEKQLPANTGRDRININATVFCPAWTAIKRH